MKKVLSVCLTFAPLLTLTGLSRFVAANEEAMLAQYTTGGCAIIVL